ncbi:MAG: BBP7 family outer membrane beta-barrel protein [Pirellulales bacterium]|nr:BBP7 family outer membrane beta-barrel protein [Pirellulales bacterium]
MKCRWFEVVALAGLVCACQALQPTATGQERARSAPRSTPPRVRLPIDPLDEFSNPAVSVAEEDPRWTPRRPANRQPVPARQSRTTSHPASSQPRSSRAQAARANHERYSRERAAYDDEFGNEYDDRVAPASYNDGYYDPTVRGNTDVLQHKYDQEYVEYDHEYGVRYRPYRIARTAYDDPLPLLEEVAPPGEWHGDYAPNYDPAFDAGPGGPGSYRDMDPYAYGPPPGGCRSGQPPGGCAAGGYGGGCGSHPWWYSPECCDPLFDDTYTKSFGLWAQADYLLWWTKGESVPALVTTSPAETPRPQAGVLGQPGTETLYGGDRYLNDYRSGGRLDFGAWLNQRRSVGIGGGFFALEDATSSFSATSLGEPILARPFFNPNSGAQDSALVAYSSTATGDIIAGTINANTSNSLINANAYMTGMLFRNNGVRFDLLGGYRFTRFDESVGITENLVITEQGGLVPTGTTFNTLDTFDVTNTFNGGELGLLFETTTGRWSMDGAFKLGLGNMHETVNIWGSTIVTPPGGGSDSREGGLLALPSNIGYYSRNEFAVVPEAQINLSYHFTTWWRVQVGYTFIYWNNVVRAGHQIDTTVNTTQLDPVQVGPDRPAFSFVSGDLWAQGLNVGTELRY